MIYGAGSAQRSPPPRDREAKGSCDGNPRQFLIRDKENVAVDSFGSFHNRRDAGIVMSTLGARDMGLLDL